MNRIDRADYKRLQVLGVQVLTPVVMVLSPDIPFWTRIAWLGLELVWPGLCLAVGCFSLAAWGLHSTPGRVSTGGASLPPSLRGNRPVGGGEPLKTRQPADQRKPYLMGVNVPLLPAPAQVDQPCVPSCTTLSPASLEIDREPFGHLRT